MPMKPMRPCRYPGCSRLVAKGVYCDEHRQPEKREGSNARGYDSKWRKARNAFLRSYPLCTECLREGKLTPATVVDHIVPHRGDQRLFWDTNNWQSLCEKHHNKKTGSGL